MFSGFSIANVVLIGIALNYGVYKSAPEFYFLSIRSE